MKGIILAGGNGTRLWPLTKVTNKHLLPVYDKPMIMYPLQTLVGAGITDVMVVCGKDHAHHFTKLLNPPNEYGLTSLHYAVQEGAGGIAEALGLTERFGRGDDVAVHLGDNIYEKQPDLSAFKGGARIYLKQVPDAHRFGVAEFTGGALGAPLERIIEKPKDPPSQFAVTGLYLYDDSVYDIIRTLKPSERNELEITDVNNAYLRQGRLEYRTIEGDWTDAGTFDSLLRASMLAHRRARARRNGP